MHKNEKKDLDKAILRRQNMVVLDDKILKFYAIISKIMVWKEIFY